MDPDQVMSVVGSVRALLKEGKTFEDAFWVAVDGLYMSASETPVVKKVVGRLVGEGRIRKKRREKRRKEPAPKPDLRPYRPPYSDG